MAERDPDSGQFTAASTELFGNDAALADAGYTKMPERERDDEELTIEQARELLPDDEEHVITRQYTDAEGNPVPENETVSLERAAADLAAEQDKDAFELVHADDEAFAKYIDTLRGESEPKAETAKPAEQPLDAIDPAALESHPKFKELVESKIGEAQQENFKGIADNYHLMAALISEQIPEMQAVPIEHWSAVLAEMQRTNDPRLSKIMALDQKAGQIAETIKHQMARTNQLEEQRREALFKAEDARFADMIKGETPETKEQVQRKILDTLSQAGIPPQAFMDAYRTQPFLRTAAAQKFMYEGAKAMIELEKLRRAPKARPFQNLPSVQRPGSTAPRGNADTVDALSRRLDQTGNINDAWALFQARQRG